MISAPAALARDIPLATLGRRARKKVALSASLRHMALEMFERDGYEATTCESIATAVDVAARTLYRYYPTKEALLFGDQVTRSSSLHDLLSAQPQTASLEVAVTAALVWLRDDANDQRDLLLAQLAISKRDPAIVPSLLAHRLVLQHIIHAFVAARLVDPDDLGLDAHRLSALPFNAFSDQADQWLADGAVGAFDPPIVAIVAGVQAMRATRE